MIKEKISQELKTAMKNGDQLTVELFRGLNSAINNKVIEKRSKAGASADLSEEEIIQVLASEAKKRKESAEAFKQGGRNELAEKEEKELIIIQTYLPKQLSEEDVKKIIEKILFENSGVDNFGLAMKLVMADLRGKADSGLITKIVKEKFQ